MTDAQCSDMNEDEELAKQLQLQYDQEASNAAFQRDLLVNDQDEELAKLLQLEFEDDLKAPGTQSKRPGKATDVQIPQADDPTPDLHLLFLVSWFVSIAFACHSVGPLTNGFINRPSIVLQSEGVCSPPLNL